MRFVSKSSNLMVVLRPGIPGSPITGQQPVNGIYIKFSGGAVEVKDEKFIEMMKNHPGFGRDFIIVDENAADPYEYHRNEVEPPHIIQEMKYGHIENSIGSKKNTKLSPEIKKFLEEEATKMAKAMLPDMVKEVLKSMGKEESEKDDSAGEKAIKTETDAILKKDAKKKVKDSEEDAPTA